MDPHPDTLVLEIHDLKSPLLLTLCGLRSRAAIKNASDDILTRVELSIGSHVVLCRGAGLAHRRVRLPNLNNVNYYSVKMESESLVYVPLGLK